MIEKKMSSLILIPSYASQGHMLRGTLPPLKLFMPEKVKV